MSTFHRDFHVFVRVGFGELVESHMNVGADLPLSLHREFGRHLKGTAVDMAFKLCTGLVDFYVWERENLEAAGVSKGWFLPVHKARESACFAD